MSSFEETVDTTVKVQLFLLKGPDRTLTHLSYIQLCVWHSVYIVLGMEQQGKSTLSEFK